MVDSIPSRYQLRVKQRRRVVEFADDHGFRAAARHFGLARRTVRTWCRRWKTAGDEGLVRLESAPDVYRNERLLVAGDWLGLGFAKEEHFKLARIQLDIPNSMDQEWEIDVTKSKARPPDALRAELRYLASVTRSRASEIYRHRGKTLARSAAQSFVFLWEQLTRRGKYFYKINRGHPLIADALAQNRKLVEPTPRVEGRRSAGGWPIHTANFPETPST